MTDVSPEPLAIKPEQAPRPMKRIEVRAEDLLARKIARDALQAFRDAGYTVHAVELWAWESPKRELAYAMRIEPNNSGGETK